jgi:hypothetical protein
VRVSEAMTRDVCIAGQRVGRHPGQAFASRESWQAPRRLFIAWSIATLGGHGGIGEASGRLSRASEQNTQTG